MRKRILVVGSVNVDHTVVTPHFPVPGETVTGSGFSVQYGGKGANQAVTLARAGCDVSFLGAVGRDAAGDAALAYLRAEGIAADAVARAEAPTGAAVITVCEGENEIIVDPGANACVTPETIEENAALFRAADFVVLQYEISSEAVLAAAKAARAAGACLVVNPAPAREMPSALYPLCDWFVPNETEAALLTGQTDARAAIAALCEKGCRNVLVTLGARGCAYNIGDTVAYGQSFPVKAVDTTAAGDSFIGGFVAALARGADVPAAVRRAAATAAIAVTRPGAAASVPTAADVDAFLASR